MRMRQASGLGWRLTAALWVLLAGCATPTASPVASSLPSASLQANQLLRSDVYEAVLTLLDETGIVTRMASGAPSVPVEAVNPYAIANRQGDLSKLELSWMTNPMPARADPDRQRACPWSHLDPRAGGLP